MFTFLFCVKYYSTQHKHLKIVSVSLSNGHANKPTLGIFTDCMVTADRDSIHFTAQLFCATTVNRKHISIYSAHIDLYFIIYILTNEK